MKKTMEYKSPSERTDDLSEWGRVEDVDQRIRDLPASFALKESDLMIPEQKSIGQVVEQYNNPDTPTQRKAAEDVLSRLQLIVLNLMAYASGYRDKEPITSPVKEWPTYMLVGDRTQPSNFGNVHEVSRIPEDNRHATPISPGEGWWFRMVDYENNFLVVVRSLTFHDSDHEKATEENTERQRNRDKAKWARKMIEQIMA